ncbi:N-acetyl-gamma-glutamyl-phosphate reductase [Sphingomonas paeninsulae]|uniref:N-acetyl-gamma-glutamyl-phosphate reductase n=1 Tax=Sphingomonas paeninsulae TaxID=2319844 RepID=A0A494TP17_SPHPE|nr:N-acetyl-gamma-glutamyl-phosphate reductase [Sphingomonas paeninsulae]AYJ87601.1 N-acetyl-gamma-glutamyl-phosphate reductase [Sphingomonas paeninsulae]
MMRIFIDGAAGTTGLEIETRLTGRPEFELLKLDDSARKNAAARKDALNAADIVILCLPDDAAREAVSLIDNSHTRVIDASTSFRTTTGWTYGFPELGNDVAGAMRVSNPGCYPTGFLALVTPLIRAGLIPKDWPITVNAVSGYSGGGKAMIAEFESGQPQAAWRTYALTLAHKHIPEMQRHSGLSHGPIFAPSVASTYRGMIVEVPLHLGAMPAQPSVAIVREALAQAFSGSSIVTLPQPPELLTVNQAADSDRLDLFVFGNAEGTQARLVAALDNLGKGASGAAVQSLNLMAGLPETTGLRL